MSKGVEIVGLDAGNGFIKVSSAAKERAIESMYARYDDAKDVLSNRAPVTTYTPQRVGNETYVLGQRDVSEHGIGMQMTLDLDQRMNRREYGILLQLALAYSLPFHRDARVVLVAGVPAEEDTAASQQAYRSLIGGINRINVSGNTHTLDVVQTYVLHQPTGLLLDLHLDHEGYPANEKIISGENLIVDIGEGTTDVSVYRGLRRVDGFSVRMGMSEVAKRLQISVASQFRRARPRMADVQAALRSDKVLRIGREEVDLNPVLDRTMRGVASEILGEVQSQVPDRSRMSHVIFGGGGSAALQQYLMEWEPTGIVVPDQLAIARGFQKFGVAKARQEGVA